MRLIKVNASRIKLRCVKCGAIHQENEMYADLDGKPFVDYFCRDCATLAEANEVFDAAPVADAGDRLLTINGVIARREYLEN